MAPDMTIGMMPVQACDETLVVAVVDPTEALVTMVAYLCSSLVPLSLPMTLSTLTQLSRTLEVGVRSSAVRY